MGDYKLYLWFNVFNIEYGGVAFAVARSLDEAIQQIASAGPRGEGEECAAMKQHVERELRDTQPEVHDLPWGCYFYY